MCTNYFTLAHLTKGLNIKDMSSAFCYCQNMLNTRSECAIGSFNGMPAIMLP